MLEPSKYEEIFKLKEMKQIFKYLVSTILIGHSIVRASHGSFKSCYDCVAESPENKLCNWGMNSIDPWKYACCSPDNPSMYCKASEHNKCTPSYSEVKELFYTYCPLVNNTMCGTES